MSKIMLNKLQIKRWVLCEHLFAILLKTVNSNFYKKQTNKQKKN